MRVLPAAVFLVVGLAAAPAAGQEAGPQDGERARELSRKALDLYNRREYGRALPLFEQAYQATPLPNLVYNIAQCQRFLGRCEDSEASYVHYLALVPGHPHRAEIEGFIADMHRCAADGRERARRAKEAEAERRRAEERVRADERRRVEAEVRGAQARREQQAAASQGHGRTLRIAGIGTAAAGGALLGAGGFFGLRARSAAAEVSDVYERGGAWDADAAAADARGRRAQTITVITLAAGTVGVAAGVTMYLLGRRAGERRPAVTGALTPTSVTLAWTF